MTKWGLATPWTGATCSPVFLLSLVVVGKLHAVFLNETAHGVRPVLRNRKSGGTSVDGLNTAGEALQTFSLHLLKTLETKSSSTNVRRGRRTWCGYANQGKLNWRTRPPQWGLGPRVRALWLSTDSCDEKSELALKPASPTNQEQCFVARRDAGDWCTGIDSAKPARNLFRVPGLLSVRRCRQQRRAAD